MLVNFREEDLRVKKVDKALHAAMLTLLNSQKFKKITVSSLCDEAMISRATFYSHYLDKYDMLQDWLIEYQPYKLEKDAAYEQVETAINRFFNNNEKIIINLLSDADDETLEIFCRYILYVLDIADKKNINGKQSHKDVVFSNFCSGGILYYLMWQIKNKFPSDMPTMNKHVYHIIEKFRQLEAEQDE